MPSSSKTSSYSFNSRGEDENDPAPQDFRNLDPFSLFTSMFPQFRNDRTMPERNTQRFPYLDTFGEHDDFLEDLGGFLKDPLLARPSFAGGRKKHSSGCRTVTEKQERAHMDRHGHLEISQSQKTMEVHKSGGFTYSSCSFSGSFGPGVGNGNMLAALMSGGMSMGASRDDGVGSASTGFRGMFGTPDFGDALPQPRTRVRRPSFGALEESIAPHSHSSKPSSRSLTRRSSFGQLNGGISSPAAHALGNDYSLAAYAGFDGEITRYPGW